VLITRRSHGGAILFRKNVYILGAGFSANAGAPVMRNFVEHAKLLRDDPRLGLPAEDQKTFERVFRRLAELRVAQARMAIDIENIEHLFSLLDMDIEFGGKSAGTLRQDLIFLILRTLEKTIQTKNLPSGGWGLPFFMGDGKPNVSRGVAANYVDVFAALASRRWISGTLGRPQNGKCQDTIITLNYDCLLDDCLTKIGVQPDYGLQDPELPKEFKQCGYEIPVLKLHGSANWFRCNSGRCVGKVVIAGGTPAKRLEYFYGQHCPHCGQNVAEPVIVPPTWAKGGQSEVLRPVWSKALEALREAGRIFIIGYSMPSTDQFFRYMLALALATNEMLDKVVVVNTSPDAQKTFEDLFHSQFGIRKLKPVDLPIADYSVRGGNDSLGFELGQFQAGLDQSMIEDSGFRFQ
jgi:NAD-dependent SIR2 family protein deacetylase